MKKIIILLAFIAITIKVYAHKDFEIKLGFANDIPGDQIFWKISPYKLAYKKHYTNTRNFYVDKKRMIELEKDCNKDDSPKVDEKNKIFYCDKSTLKQADYNFYPGSTIYINSPNKKFDKEFYDKLVFNMVLKDANPKLRITYICIDKRNNKKSYYSDEFFYGQDIILSCCYE